MDFNELFTGWNTMDSLAILFFMVIAFLFGFILAYLLRSMKIRKLRSELKTKKKQLSDKEAEVAGLREQIDLKEADLKKANFELEELNTRVVRLHNEKQQAYDQLLEVQAEIDKLKASNKTYVNTIEDLNNQIVGLKTKNEQLSEEMESEDESIESLAQIQSIYNATRNRLEAMENKLERLEGENQTLRVELDSIKESGIIQGTPRSVQPRDLEDAPLVIDDINGGAEEAAEEEEEVGFAPNMQKNVLNEKIIVDEEVEKDDLTRIEGIGPFIQKQLNEIGIFTYDGIMDWDAEHIREVTEKIGYFPGRIEQDNWVGQAALLSEQKKNNPEAFTSKSKNPTNSADLKIVEGIGPKIEELLKAAGINTWEELADASAEELKHILAEAGDHYRIHDPGTWPNQARLAANGEWALLQEYQDELNRGREPED